MNYHIDLFLICLFLSSVSLGIVGAGMLSDHGWDVTICCPAQPAGMHALAKSRYTRTLVLAESPQARQLALAKSPPPCHITNHRQQSPRGSMQGTVHPRSQTALCLPAHHYLQMEQLSPELQKTDGKRSPSGELQCKQAAQPVGTYW